MRDRFWQSPGPQRVLVAVRDTLLAGESVVLRQPDWAPDLLEPLVAALPPQRPCHDLEDSEQDGRTPDVLLRECLGLGPGTGAEACAARHAEPVVIVRSARGARLQAWARLVRRHHHATRDTSGGARLLLLASPAERLDMADLGATPVVDWRDAVGRLDMHLYAAFLWSRRSLPVLERELCIALTREIAGWCPDLAERLVAAGPEAVFQPTAVLTALSAERGWGCAVTPRWANGTEDRRDGVALVHAALAAARGEAREIKRRLWRAQTEVLFPVVELVRAELARRYARLLEGVTDEVTKLHCDPLDVDVGPLAYRLVAAPGVSEGHRRLVAAIRDLRRAIAHREPLPRGAALNPVLVRVVEDGMRIEACGR